MVISKITYQTQTLIFEGTHGAIVREDCKYFQKNVIFMHTITPQHSENKERKKMDFENRHFMRWTAFLLFKRTEKCWRILKRKIYIDCNFTQAMNFTIQCGCCTIDFIECYRTVDEIDEGTTYELFQNMNINFTVVLIIMALFSNFKTFKFAPDVIFNYNIVLLVNRIKLIKLLLRHKNNTSFTIINTYAK